MKLGILASIATITGALAFATFSTTTPADAADKCQRNDFKTEMVKKACETGGQKAAKDAMKGWMKEKKIKSCNQCHTKLAPTYELKTDGLEQFKKLGGVVLDTKKTDTKKTDVKKVPDTKAAPTK